MNEYEGMTDVQLNAVIDRLNSEVTELGVLYNEIEVIELSEFQKGAIRLNQQGYDFGEQIHDIYSEIGYVSALIKKWVP